MKSDASGLTPDLHPARKLRRAFVEPNSFLDVVVSPVIDPPFSTESFLDDVADGLEDWTPSSRDDELGVRAGGER